MLKMFFLILPVLIPSWRFFKTIEPSPRVQWALFSDADQREVGWCEFWPRPLAVTPFEMLRRLVWSPTRNEELFVLSCAERIAEQPLDHSVNEVNWRIRADLKRRGIEGANKKMRFRLVFVTRTKTQLSEEVLYVSEPVSAV